VLQAVLQAVSTAASESLIVERPFRMFRELNPGARSVCLGEGEGGAADCSAAGLRGWCAASTVICCVRVFRCSTALNSDAVALVLRP
jgi:hypothetical protein